MIKQFFLGLFLFTLCIPLSAQKNNIEYGFQSGVNINSAYGNAINKSVRKSAAGFSIGGHFKIQTSKHFAFKALLAYEQNGWTYRSLVFASGPGSAFFKLNYLNLPLLVEYSYGNKIKFNIDGGVFGGYLLSNKLTIKITGDTPSTESSSSDARKSVNFGISAGAGAQFPLASKLKLDFGIRNNLGLANINKSANVQQSSSIKTNALSILAGVTFQL